MATINGLGLTLEQYRDAFKKVLLSKEGFAHDDLSKLHDGLGWTERAWRNNDHIETSARRYSRELSSLFD